MSGSWSPARGVPQTLRHQYGRGGQQAAHAPCLYAVVLREAIAAQHRLTQSGRFDLHACDGCGKPYLLASIWQPISEQGVLACPRCGAEAIAWDGARGYVAYWHRDQTLRGRPSSGAGAGPAPLAAW
jgi:DNA-directed RNA polymerase subunit RPC12/RpoP